MSGSDVSKSVRVAGEEGERNECEGERTKTAAGGGAAAGGARAEASGEADGEKCVKTEE